MTIDKCLYWESKENFIHFSFWANVYELCSDNWIVMNQWDIKVKHLVRSLVGALFLKQIVRYYTFSFPYRSWNYSIVNVMSFAFFIC